MKKINGMSLDQIATDMVDMRVFKLEDIQHYGFTELEAKEIQKEIAKQ